jgi:hypothetical protein
MLALASLSLALRPLPSSHRARPRLRYGAAFACTSSTPAELAQQAIQSGDALQIEEAMRAIIDLERSVGRPEADIPNNPLLQQLSAAQRQLNPEVFAAGSAESPEVFSAEADLSDPAVIARAAAAARQAGAEDVERQEPPPQAGVQAWGQWRHGAEGIEVQLELAATADGPVRAKGVRVEVVDGCLFAQLEGDPAPLLFGRFRHDVKASELSWMIDESERGCGTTDARPLSDFPSAQPATRARAPNPPWAQRRR